MDDDDEVQDQLDREEVRGHWCSKDGCLLLQHYQQLCVRGTCYYLHIPTSYWSELINFGWSPQVPVRPAHPNKG